MELMFDSHKYSEGKKVKLFIIEFMDYCVVGLACDESKKELWETCWDLGEMNVIIRRWFILSHYYRELYQKL